MRTNIGDVFGRVQRQVARCLDARSFAHGGGHIASPAGGLRHGFVLDAAFGGLQTHVAALDAAREVADVALGRDGQRVATHDGAAEVGHCGDFNRGFVSRDDCTSFQRGQCHGRQVHHGRQHFLAVHFHLNHPDDALGQVCQLFGRGCLAINQAQGACLVGSAVHHALDLASEVLLACQQAGAGLRYQLLLHQIGFVARVAQALLRAVGVHAQLLCQVVRAHGRAAGLEHRVAFHQELGRGAAVGDKVAVGVARQRQVQARNGGGGNAATGDIGVARVGHGWAGVHATLRACSAAIGCASKQVVGRADVRQGADRDRQF